MRSNLLSLQRTAEQFSVTQKRLSTGLKVSSATDGVSSYYSAASLNNRAKALESLLDNVSQGSLIVKTAIDTLEFGVKLLEQAKVLANSVMENAGSKQTISLDWLIEQGLDLNKVATDSTSLINKLASANAGDTVYVMGNINMGTSSLTVKDGVRLVGMQTFVEEIGKADTYDAAGLSSIYFNMGMTNNKGVIMGNNSSLSDLTIRMDSDMTASNGGTVYINSKTGVKLHNLNLSLVSTRTNNQSNYIGVISNTINSVTELSGRINIRAEGDSIQGIFHNGYFSHPTLNIKEDTILNIETFGRSSSGLRFGHVNSKGIINITTHGGISNGIDELVTSNIEGIVQVDASGQYSRGVKGVLNIGNDSILMVKSYWTDAQFGPINLGTDVKVSVSLTSDAGHERVYETSGNTSIIGVIPDPPSSPNLVSSSYTYAQLEEDKKQKEYELLPISDLDISMNTIDQYNNLLKQYDELIKDGYYRNVNLLLEQNATVYFNEDRSSNLLVKGVDATSEGLGLNPATWSNLGNVYTAIMEIENAIKQIKSISADFSTNYNIIIGRENFMEEIVNILREGADKLTLADMNEESANMLALQLRQDLSTQALSLASEASKAVLKIF